MTSKGYIQSSEHRAKLSHFYFKKGVKRSNEWIENKRKMMKGNTNGFKKGRIVSIDSIEKMIKTFKRLGIKPPIMKGKKHYNWKGGITPVISAVRNCSKYREWVKNVLFIDNFTCKWCKKRGGNLEVHHIKSFSNIWKENNIKSFQEAMRCKELWELKNGLTLCIACHKKTKKVSMRDYRQTKGNL